MKQCPRCKEEKTPEDFYKDRRRKDGLTIYCKPCHTLVSSGYDKARKKATAQNWQQEHREERNAKSRVWRQANREKTLEYQRKSRAKYGRKHKLAYTYGLTLDEYNAMLERQNGCCAVCGQPFTEPHVDHCHATGQVRSLLCRSCNLGLGFFKDNPDLLQKAAQYLSDWQATMNRKAA